MKKQTLSGRLMVLAVAAALSLTSVIPAMAAERLDTPEDVYWGGKDEDDTPENGTYAWWDEVENAYEYELYLYCEESKVKEVKTKKTKFNFSKFMTKEGDYTFRVRALAKSKDRDYKTGLWSDYSDVSYVDADQAERIKSGDADKVNNVGPGVPENAAGGQAGTAGVQTETASGQAGTAGVQTGAAGQDQWLNDTVGWWYRRADGSYPKDGWFQDPADGHWYFFDASGYMMTGWIDWNGQRYFCNPLGTPAGAMVTGSNTIDGQQYEFDGSGAVIH